MPRKGSFKQYMHKSSKCHNILSVEVEHPNALKVKDGIIEPRNGTA